jgi:hypothetical protein
MSDQIDQLGIPTHECFNCGSNMFNIVATFENYEVAMYMDEGTCALCDSPVTLPTLLDHPYWNKETKEVDDDLPKL